MFKMFGSKDKAAEKPAENKDLKFNAADLDDVDKSTHRKRRAAPAAAPAAAGGEASPAPAAAEVK